MSTKLTWMPGVPATESPARMAMPRPPDPALAQKPDPKYAAVYAPIAKKAT